MGGFLLLRLSDGHHYHGTATSRPHLDSLVCPGRSHMLREGVGRLQEPILVHCQLILPRRCEWRKCSTVGKGAVASFDARARRARHVS